MSHARRAVRLLGQVTPLWFAYDVRAGEFDGLYDEHVRRPATAVGWEPWGKSRLRIAYGPVRAALVRTELRHTWPFELTFLASHECIRDFKDVRGGFPSEPSEWVVKANPGELSQMTKRWRYSPHNLGHVPALQMSDRNAAKQLRVVGADLVAITPVLEEVFESTRLLDELRRHGENAWCEQRWIEDLTAAR